MKSRFSITPEASGRDEVFLPQLTSLIDVMTILLVFLMKSFSAEGNLVTPSADLVLPQSTAESRPETVVSVMVTAEEVLVDHIPVGSSRGDSPLIEPLHTHLRSIRGENTRMMIQADRDLPFETVKRVMYTCSTAGFKNFTVLVMREEL